MYNLFPQKPIEINGVQVENAVFKYAAKSNKAVQELISTFKKENEETVEYSGNLMDEDDVNLYILLHELPSESQLVQGLIEDYEQRQNQEKERKEVEKNNFIENYETIEKEHSEKIVSLLKEPKVIEFIISQKEKGYGWGETNYACAYGCTKSDEIIKLRSKGDKWAWDKYNLSKYKEILNRIKNEFNDDYALKKFTIQIINGFIIEFTNAL